MARAHPVPIVAVLALALVVAHAPEAGALPRAKDRWIQVDTANFTLFSNATPATAKNVGEDLEQVRAVLSSLTGGEVNAPIPTLIYVFRDDRSFTPYKPIHDGKPAELSSLFQPRQHANYISLNGALRGQATKSIYTMYAFNFLHNNLPGLPLWFSRGLAEYYGTLEINKKRTNVGKPDIGHLRRLREHPTVHLAELFATEQHPDYRLGEPAYRFDAYCWVVVHYLLTADPERRKQTFEFIGQLMGGAPQDAAFERAFKTTYGGMQRELTSYIRKFTFGYLRFDLAKTDTAEAQVETLAYADALYRLGDLLASQIDLRREAVEHFRATLREDPQHALALAGLGLVEERQDRHQAALEHYRKAAALAPDDFLIQYRYAGSLLREGDGSRAAEAQEALERSVAANPGFAPAWADLAYAYAFEEEPSRKAIAAAETAHRLLPSDKSVAYNLLLLYTRAGLREPARTLVDRFFVRQATAAELAEARSQLAYLDITAAYDLLGEGQTEAAGTIYDDLEAVSADGQVNVRTVEQIRRLGQDIEGRRLSDLYNKAVDRYGAGDFAAASGLLQDVLAQSQDAGLIIQARALLEEAQKQQGGGR